MNFLFTLLAWAPDALVIPLAWLALKKWKWENEKGNDGRYIDIHV